MPAAGAEALDKKQRKQFEAWQLQNVKAAPQKPGRVSAAIGKGQSQHMVSHLVLWLDDIDHMHVSGMSCRVPASLAGASAAFTEDSIGMSWSHVCSTVLPT